MLDLIWVAALVGLLYVPLALGLYLSIGVLSLPDLTVEGSFGVGGGAAAALLVAGYSPWTAVAGAIVAGMAMGLVAGLLHIRLRLNVLLAGLLMMTAGWSITLMVMGSANLSILTETTLVTMLRDAGLDRQWAIFVLGALASVITGAGLVWFLRTRYGLTLRAAGMNVQTARSLGVRTEHRQVLGLVLANGLAALSASLVVQSQGFMDVSIQSGVVVVALAGLMVGRAVLPSSPPLLAILGAILGVIIYRAVVALALDAGVDANQVGLITALIVVVVIAGRSVLGDLLTQPLTQSIARRRRTRLEYLEDDHVINLI